MSRGLADVPKRQAYYKWIDRKIYTYKYKKACREADRVIAISEATKRDIVKFFGIAPEKIDVVYQGCDEQFKREVPQTALQSVRAKYALPQHYVLTVGSIEQRKNLLLVVQAAARMAEPPHIVAVGRRTPYTALVERYAVEHGLSERLHIHDKVEFADLPAVYRMADAFVYPSRFEGFGIPMIEAACCGVPTVGATGSCLEEAGGPGAAYVDPDDPQALADWLTEILSDESLRRRMVDAGREYVARFEPERITADLLRVYQRVLTSE
ncbi:MAG: glycosyltransferase family 4 protein, partial [Alistipes sp.]|nr:glycosyltransferase family 4 protein [Alistipes sp.]